MASLTGKTLGICYLLSINIKRRGAKWMGVILLTRARDKYLPWAGNVISCELKKANTERGT